MSDPVRLDVWLWAARFYKTRALARQAVEKGQVRIGGQRLKPGRNMRCGELIELKQGWANRAVEVLALSQQRGPAAEAQQLYRETAESRQKNEQEAALRRSQRAGLELPKGRPDKHQRRALGRIKREQAG